MSAQGDAVRTGSLETTLNSSLWSNASPPSAIAVKLLQKTFLLLVDLYPNQSRQPEWIAVTYVCRYWRSAALGLPELWTCITPSLSISWSQALMERSAPLPMHISRHTYGPCADEAAALNAARAERAFAQSARAFAMSAKAFALSDKAFAKSDKAIAKSDRASALSASLADNPLVYTPLEDTSVSLEDTPSEDAPLEDAPLELEDASITDGAEVLAASGLLSACTLRLFGRPADMVEVLNRLCSPSLESLSLYVTGAAESVELPETMCERDTPHFRRLTFGTGVRIRAPLWLLASVTHFTTHASTPLHELLGTLQAMPQLEVLRLKHTSSESGFFDPLKFLLLPRAVLPRLSLLSVDEFSPNCLLILSSHIDAPPTLRRHLFWSVYPLEEWNPDVFTVVHAQALVPHDSAPGIDDGGLRAAQVTGGPASGSFGAWSRTGSEGTGADTGAFACKDALFLLEIEWFDVGNGPVDPKCPFFHLASLCAHLQAARIEDLTVAHKAPRTHKCRCSQCMATGAQADVQDAPVVRAQWQALLAALPSVKTLRLHRGKSSCVSVLRALAEFPHLLPHLRKVFVVQSPVLSAVVPGGGVVADAAGPAAPEGDVVADADADSAATEGSIVAVADSAAPGGGVVAEVDAGSVTAAANHILKFVRENVGAELVEAVSVRSGLEVVLVGCEVDEETLEALRKRAQVDFGNELEYIQSVHVTLD